MKLTFRLPRPQAAPHNAEGLAYDCELAERILDGDGVALERLVDRHMPVVNRYVQHRLGPGHEEDAWKVVRATFDDALRKLGPYGRKSATTPMGYWLIRLAERNLSRYMHGPKGDEGSKARFQAKGDENDLVIVRSALGTLPRKHSGVLALALFEGMGSEGIAYTLGVRQAIALRRLRAALKQIGKKIAPDENEDEF